jgi:hypothetical protein
MEAGAVHRRGGRVTQPDLFNQDHPPAIFPPTFWEAMGLWMVGEGPDPRKETT